MRRNEDLDCIRSCIDGFGPKFLIYSPVYKSLTGDSDSALLLAQLVFYWCNVFGQQEFWRTDEALEADLGCSRFTLSHCRKKLESLGFVKLSRKGSNNRNHYTVNIKAIACAIRVQINPNPPVVPDEPKPKLKEPKEAWVDKDEKDWNFDDKCNFIFHLWNSKRGLKKNGKPSWYGHRKLTPLMKSVIKEALKDSKGYEDLDVSVLVGAVENYVKVLESDRTFWTYCWTLTDFFSVRHNREKDSHRKWWQFIEDNFQFDRYVIEEDESEQQVPDHDEEIMTLVLNRYRRLIGNKDLELDYSAACKFAEATNRIEAMASTKEMGVKELVKHFFAYLRYDLMEEKQQRVHPGTLCSSNTWNVFPQYLIEAGIF